jgi:hypothetical protein
LYADTAHLSTLGYQLLEADLQPLLPAGGAGQPSPLPAYVNAAAADYEHTPVVKLGTQHDAHTGVWTETGTSIASTTPGDTITFSGTFRTFGCYRADATYPQVTFTIDGGAPIADSSFYPNGYDTGARSAHTIVITVQTTCKIDEF